MGDGGSCDSGYGLRERLLDHLRRDPERARQAVELGLVPPAALEGDRDVSLLAHVSSGVLERFLNRAQDAGPPAIRMVGSAASQLLGRDGNVRADSARAEELTIVFSDLEGFTAFTSTHGDGAALELLTEHHRLASGVIHRHQGRIVKRMGDGLLMRFRRPRAGLRAAVELLDCAPEPLRLRCGVHLGEVMVSSGDLYGHHVNLASRVTDLAPGGQALATEEAVAAARGEGGDIPGLTVGKLNRVRVKGVEGRVGVHRVEPATRHFLMPSP